MRAPVFRLPIEKRKQLIRKARQTSDPATALRMRLVARMGIGVSGREAAEAFGCVPATAMRARQRYVNGGWRALLDGRAANGTRKVDGYFLAQLRRILTKRPSDFGWSRTTWSRELIGLQLKALGLPAVADATIGRALSTVGARLGMAKPIVICPWPRQERLRTIARIRRLANRDSDTEPVFYEDEIDIHLNPKIGRDWMLPGTQRLIVTPGKNKKHYLAGALRAGSRKVTWVAGDTKSSDLFIKMMFRLASEHRTARRIHIVLDNFGIHSSKKTKKAVEQFEGRIVLHFLPPYTPEANKIERLWKDVHDNVTRNHQRGDIETLMNDVVAYLRARNRRPHNPTTYSSRVSESRAAI